MAVRALHWSNPFATPANRSQSLSGGISPYRRTGGGAGGMTQLQMLQAVYAAQQHGSQSFGSSLLHDVGAVAHPALWSLSQLMRPEHAVAGAIAGGGGLKKAAWLGLLPVSAPLGIYEAAKHGFSGRGAVKQAVHDSVHNTGPLGGELLKQAGLLKHHNTLRGLAGFGLDVGLDPLTYVTGGTEPIAAHAGGEAAIKATKALDMAIKDGRPAEHYAQQLQRFQPHYNTLTELGKTQPEKFTQRAHAAQVLKDALTHMASGGVMEPGRESAIHTARMTAEAEAKLHDGRGLALKFGSLGKTGPLPIKLPGHGALGNAGIPGISRVARTLGKAFKPGYEDPITHAADLARRHMQEQLTERYVNHLVSIFKGHKNISGKRAVEVISHFEKPGSIVKYRGKYVLSAASRKAAEKAGFTKEEVNFAQRVHEAGGFLNSQDKAFGLKYRNMNEKGRIYVPHILARDAPFVMHDMGTDLLSVRGFTKERARDLTLHDLAKLHEGGQLPRGMELDPFKLLFMRASAAASQHADINMIRHLSDSVGVPKRLVDRASLGTAEKKVAKLEEKIAGHPMSNGMAVQAGKVRQATIDALKQGLILKHQDRVTQNTKRIKALLEGDQGQTTLATVGRMSKRTLAWNAQHAKDLAAIDNGTHRGLKARVAEADAPFKTARKDYRALNAELKQAKRVAKAIRKGKANPAYDPMKHLTVDGRDATQKGILRTPEGHKIGFPKEVANAMLKLHHTVSGNEPIVKEFEKTVRKVQSKWKLTVTALNLGGYGVRNTVSDLWNMWLSGVPLHAIPVYAAKAGKLMRDFHTATKAREAGRPLTTAQQDAVRTMRDAYGAGVLSGLFQGDVQQGGKYLQTGHSKIATLLGHNGVRPKPVKAYSEMMQSANRTREDFGRLTHYLYRTEGEKMGPTAAAREVKKAHFDYEDLTPFEQKVMKNIMPFYTWTRKNLPYQIERMGAAPGRMAAFPTLGAELAQANGYKGDVPSYVRDQMMLNLPGGKFLSPMAGVTDLMKAEDPKGTFLQLLNPLVSDPAQIMLNRNAMTGQPISDPTGHPLVPMRDGIVASALHAIPGNPLGVGVTERNGVRGAGIKPWAGFLANLTPESSAVVNRGGKIYDSKNISNKALLSELLGINITKVDPKVQAQIDQISESNNFKGFLKGLRDQGIVPPPQKRKLSKNQRYLNNIIQRSMGG